VKYKKWLKLFCDSILITVVSHATLVSLIAVFRCVFVVPNLVPMVNRLSIAMRP
jgi:hypothetical protein